MSRENYVRVSINRDFPDGGHNGGGFATKIPQESVDDDFQPFSEKQYEIASRIWQILELIGVSWHIAMLDAMRLPQITKAVAILSDAWLESDRINEFDDCCQFIVRLERLFDLNPNSELTTEQKLLVSKLIEQGAIVILFDRVLDDAGLITGQKPRGAPAYAVGCSVGCLLLRHDAMAYTVDSTVFNGGNWWYWLTDEAGEVSHCAKEADLYLLIAD